MSVDADAASIRSASRQAGAAHDLRMMATCLPENPADSFRQILWVSNLLSGTVQVLKVTPASDQLGAKCHFSNSSLVVIPDDKNLID
ncbi:MAG: hypothetical protein ACLQO6_00920 [Desulfomonilaceae bacterium]